MEHHGQSFQNVSSVPSGVIKHGWLENPRTEIEALIGIHPLYMNGPFSTAMFDYGRVTNHIHKLHSDSIYDTHDIIWYLNMIPTSIVIKGFVPHDYK